MALNSTLKNQIPFEGTVNGTVTLNFDLPVKRIMITNDSSTADLQYKFNASRPYSTLKPTEVYSNVITVNTVYLSTTTSVSYRVWGVG